MTRPSVETLRAHLESIEAEIATLKAEGRDREHLYTERNVLRVELVSAEYAATEPCS